MTKEVIKEPIGKKWRDALKKRAARLQNRKKKPLKPAPKFRDELVARQKKARGKYE